MIKIYSILILTLILNACNSSDDDPIRPESILGSWTAQITVPPDPTAVNSYTFSGSESAGAFIDQNQHSGTWTITNDSIEWIYENVPGLNNTFKGKINATFTSMSGINFGTWQNRDFEGTWVATKN